MGSFPPKDIDVDPNMGAKFVRDLYEACDDTFGEPSPISAALQTMRISDCPPPHAAFGTPHSPWQRCRAAC